MSTFDIWRFDKPVRVSLEFREAPFSAEKIVASLMLRASCRLRLIYGHAADRVTVNASRRLLHVYLFHIRCGDRLNGGGNMFTGTLDLKNTIIKVISIEAAGAQ